MISWFRKKPEEWPKFWKNYHAHFHGSPFTDIKDISFVVFDTETTGFDYRQDRILSIGAVKVKKFSIDISTSLEYYLHQEAFNPHTVKIHGILKDEKIPRISEEEAIKDFLQYIGNSVLVAHHAHFDVNMINYALRRLGGSELKNPVLDTGVLYKKTRIRSNLLDRNKNYTLDEIAQAYDIDVKDRHTAAGDAFITAIAFLKILGKLEKTNDKTLKNLLR